MYVEATTLQWVEIAVVGGLAGIATPFFIYFLGQNRDRKNEINSAFQSVRDQRDNDQRHVGDALGELRDRTTKLQTTVDIKRETVDRVQEQQNMVGVRVAVTEQAIKMLTESQIRSDQNWLKVSEKLEGLGRIEETVKNLAEDMREVRAEQARAKE